MLLISPVVVLFRPMTCRPRVSVQQCTSQARGSCADTGAHPSRVDRADCSRCDVREHQITLRTCLEPSDNVTCYCFKLTPAMFEPRTQNDTPGAGLKGLPRSLVPAPP